MIQILQFKWWYQQKIGIKMQHIDRISKIHKSNINSAFSFFFLPFYFSAQMNQKYPRTNTTKIQTWLCISTLAKSHCFSCKHPQVKFFKMDFHILRDGGVNRVYLKTSILDFVISLMNNPENYYVLCCSWPDYG